MEECGGREDESIPSHPGAGTRALRGNLPNRRGVRQAFGKKPRYPNRAGGPSIRGVPVAWSQGCQPDERKGKGEGRGLKGLGPGAWSGGGRKSAILLSLLKDEGVPDPQARFPTEAKNGLVCSLCPNTVPLNRAGAEAVLTA
jgi:hypothetical protein